MFRQHAGESVPRGRGWDGPGLEGDPLLAELRIVSEWAQLRGTEASEHPVPTGICKPCNSSPHGGPIAGTLARLATPCRRCDGSGWTLVAVVFFRRVEVPKVEMRMEDSGVSLTDLPPSGEG